MTMRIVPGRCAIEEAETVRVELARILGLVDSRGGRLHYELGLFRQEIIGLARRAHNLGDLRAARAADQLLAALNAPSAAAS